MVRFQAQLVRRTVAAAACVLLLAPAAASAQGPRKSAFDQGLPPLDIQLTRDGVRRILEALPEITAHAAAQQSQFMGGLTGAPGGAPPQLDPAQAKKLQAIFAKHGFSMEEFALQVSALVATYLILSPDAFQRYLPSEDKPEIRAILTDPNIPAAQKDAVRQQIRAARANQGQIREQLEALASAKNKRVVEPMLAEVKKAFDQVEAIARKESVAPGPRRANSK